MLTLNNATVPQSPDHPASPLHANATPPHTAPINGGGVSPSPFVPLMQFWGAPSPLVPFWGSPLQPVSPRAGATPENPLQIAPLIVTPRTADLLNLLNEPGGTPDSTQRAFDEWIDQIAISGGAVMNATPGSAVGSNQPPVGHSSQASTHSAVPHSGAASTSQTPALHIGPGGSADSRGSSALLNRPRPVFRNLMAEFDNAAEAFVMLPNDPHTPGQDSVAGSNTTHIPFFVTPASNPPSPSVVNQAGSLPRAPVQDQSPLTPGLTGSSQSGRDARFRLADGSDSESRRVRARH